MSSEIGYCNEDKGFQPWAGREDLSWEWEDLTLGNGRYLVSKWEMDMDLVASVDKDAHGGQKLTKLF